MTENEQMMELRIKPLSSGFVVSEQLPINLDDPFEMKAAFSNSGDLIGWLQTYLKCDSRESVEPQRPATMAEVSAAMKELNREEVHGAKDEGPLPYWKMVKEVSLLVETEKAASPSVGNIKKNIPAMAKAVCVEMNDASNSELPVGYDQTPSDEIIEKLTPNQTKIYDFMCLQQLAAGARWFQCGCSKIERNLNLGPNSSGSFLRALEAKGLMKIRSNGPRRRSDYFVYGALGADGDE